MKKAFHALLVLALLSAAASCKHIDEEPAINDGYDTEVLMPDAEPMTAEDSALVAAQQAEYDKNAQ